MYYEVDGQQFYSPMYLEKCGFKHGDEVVCTKSHKHSYINVGQYFKVMSIHTPNNAWYNLKHPERLVLENLSGWSLDVSGVGCEFQIVK